MINAEKYKDELKTLNDSDELWYSGFDKRNMTFDSCINVKCENCAFNGGKGCNNARYNWMLSEYKEHFEVSKLEYELLKFWNSKKYKYIARDFSDMLFIYDEKPSKKSEIWGSKYAHCILDDFDELFQFVQWEDSEPTSIQEVLENCEVVESD